MPIGLMVFVSKGQSGALNLVVQSYAPGTIVCGSHGPLSPGVETCNSILESMPVDTTHVLFGPQWQQGVQVVIPQVYSSRKCSHFGLNNLVMSLKGHQIRVIWLRNQNLVKSVEHK
jgi:hypothetical protein